VKNWPGHIASGKPLQIKHLAAKGFNALIRINCTARESRSKAMSILGMNDRLSKLRCGPLPVCNLPRIVDIVLRKVGDAARHAPSFSVLLDARGLLAFIEL
jgi:hypothetical protein